MDIKCHKMFLYVRNHTWGILGPTPKVCGVELSLLQHATQSTGGRFQGPISALHGAVSSGWCCDDGEEHVQCCWDFHGEMVWSKWVGGPISPSVLVLRRARSHAGNFDCGWQSTEDPFKALKTVSCFSLWQLELKCIWYIYVYTYK